MQLLRRAIFQYTIKIHLSRQGKIWYNRKFKENPGKFIDFCSVQKSLQSSSFSSILLFNKAFSGKFVAVLSLHDDTYLYKHHGMRTVVPSNGYSMVHLFSPCFCVCNFANNIYIMAVFDGT